MIPRILIAALTLAVAAAAASPAVAQDVTAEVRTWSGQSLQLSQPSLEVFYTIVPTEESAGGQQYPGAAGGAPGAMGSGTSTGSLVGSVKAEPAKILPGQWNKYDITAKGDHFTISLNGKTILDAKDSKHRSGVIGFQCQKDNRIEFRNIKVRALP